MSNRSNGIAPNCHICTNQIGCLNLSVDKNVPFEITREFRSFHFDVKNWNRTDFRQICSWAAFPVNPSMADFTTSTTTTTTTAATTTSSYHKLRSFFSKWGYRKTTQISPFSSFGIQTRLTQLRSKQGKVRESVRK